MSLNPLELIAEFVAYLGAETIFGKRDPSNPPGSVVILIRTTLKLLLLAVLLIYITGVVLGI